MSRSVNAVILAGRLRQSPLRSGLDLHVLCLPVGHGGCLLDLWIARLSQSAEISDIQIVVNNKAEVERLSRASQVRNRAQDSIPRVRIVAEPAAWRGAAGVLRDVTNELPADAVVLVCEGKRLPTQSVDPVLAAMNEHLFDEQVAGVVGVCGDAEPAGISAFKRSALECIPRVGYFDLKEQFLPALQQRRYRVLSATLCQRIWRLHDLHTYLDALRQSFQLEGGGSKSTCAQKISDQASVSGSAVLAGCCVVEAGAVIEDGAVVHDSVVMSGATVGGGAVVSRSVIGPLASVAPRARIADALVAAPQHGTRNAVHIHSPSAHRVW